PDPRRRPDAQVRLEPARHRGRARAGAGLRDARAALGRRRPALVLRPRGALRLLLRQTSHGQHDLQRLHRQFNLWLGPVPPGLLRGTLMKAILAAALLCALAACSSSDNGPGLPCDGGPCLTDAGCYLNPDPNNNTQIINACTDAGFLDK